MGNLCMGASGDAALQAKVNTLWASVPKDSNNEVERLACWDLLLADAELAALVAKGNAEQGKKMLQAMKDVKALDISGDGKINESEFNRLFNPVVIAASSNRVALVAKVQKKWGEAPKGDNGAVERLACWDLIMSDSEICSLMGNKNSAKGKAILQAMKDVKALDISGDGQIDESEFMRLFNPDVIKAASLRAKVETMWTAVPKDTKGEVERLACWAFILDDKELPGLVHGDPAVGSKVLLAMKEVRALDISGDGKITYDEFQRIYDPKVIEAAMKKVA